MVRVLAIRLNNKCLSSTRVLRGILKKAQGVLKKYPGFSVAHADSFLVYESPLELGPDVATVEAIVKELGVPYDKIVAVKQVSPRATLSLSSHSFHYSSPSRKQRRRPERR